MEDGEGLSSAEAIGSVRNQSLDNLANFLVSHGIATSAEALSELFPSAEDIANSEIKIGKGDRLVFVYPLDVINYVQLDPTAATSHGRSAAEVSEITNVGDPRYRNTPYVVVLTFDDHSDTQPANATEVLSLIAENPQLINTTIAAGGSEWSYTTSRTQTQFDAVPFLRLNKEGGVTIRPSYSFVAEKVSAFRREPVLPGKPLAGN